MTDLQQILYRLDKIELLITKNKVQSRWMDETEAMAMTGLSKSSLARLRKGGVVNWSTASGRKIKYLRKDVTSYLDNNSTLTSKN